MKSKLTALMEYGFARGVGHTQATLNGLRNTPDAILIVADRAQAIGLNLKQGQYLTVDSLPQSIMGLRKAILIDHYALDILFRQHNVALTKQLKKGIE